MDRNPHTEEAIEALNRLRQNPKDAGFYAAKAMACAAVAQAVELEHMNAVLSGELHLIGERLEKLELTAQKILRRMEEEAE